MGKILVRYYLQERDESATEQQWQVRKRGFPTGIISLFLLLNGVRIVRLDDLAKTRWQRGVVAVSFADVGSTLQASWGCQPKERCASVQIGQVCGRNFPDDTKPHKRIRFKTAGRSVGGGKPMRSEAPERLLRERGQKNNEVQ